MSTIAVPPTPGPRIARPHVSAPPARRLRVLGHLWLPAGVLVGLAALSCLGTTVESLVGLMGRLAARDEPGTPLLAYAVGVLANGLATVVLGRLTWRMVVEVPCTLRAWAEALDERVAALRGTAAPR